MKPEKRDVDLVVLSDIHLGTYGCHAKELLQYLKSVNPKSVVLNGDIIDIWQFSKRYWPKTHMQVIKHITGLIAKGVKVQYITGNHDEMLRKFVGFKMGSFSIENKTVVNLNGKRGWIFHGDVFDVTMQYSKWLTMLGAVGYDSLIILNRLINAVLIKVGKGPISMSKRVKNSVKSAVKFINNFEETVADIAVRNKYDYVICGHIHQPVIRDIEVNGKSVCYLNSGDWIENLTALEYNDGNWSIYSYEDDPLAQAVNLIRNQGLKKNKELFQILRDEFNLVPA
ncbi:MAG: UDP-2,3-diacylglucosamine diphosphatase [Bacteroidota bacterium]